MKNRFLGMISIISLIFLLGNGPVFAQDIKISGKQIKGNAGQNAKLECNAVKITKTVKVIKVEGDNNGFWIQNGGVTVKNFYKPNDPSAVGLVLKPGTYFIYPNLTQNQKQATVKITLR